MNASVTSTERQPYGVIVTGTRVTIDSQPDLERFAAPDPLIDDPST